VPRGFWVATEPLLWGRGKPRKPLIQLAGRRTFLMHTDFYPAVRASNTRTLTAVPNVQIGYLNKQNTDAMYIQSSFELYLWITNSDLSDVR
jgi:hypothetical protein